MTYFSFSFHGQDMQCASNISQNCYALYDFKMELNSISTATTQKLSTWHLRAFIVILSIFYV